MAALTAACPQLKATYLILLVILYVTVIFCHLLTFFCYGAQKPPKTRKQRREEISDFYQLIQQGNWYSITGQKQKQKRIPPSEQKFSTCQIPRAFSDLSRHFFSKEVSGKISRWWKTTSGRERPPRNNQANIMQTMKAKSRLCFTDFSL